ncbi:MAG: aminotransferase class I/II-fold pyridoxal phosphate-dependent enzyme, partial [Chloroflexi bacterium]|nr:aminotransferase class I/II-fold pyridoxal phosphate-dependent enzyme [Chloroflexota bacterium]
MKLAQRVQDLPPYLFAAISKKIAEKRAAGVDVISFAIGDPDLPTPPHILDSLVEAARDPKNQGYPDSDGLPEYRKAVADWYERRFGLNFDPDTEVLPLIGSKEGIGHIPLCFVDPGDVALVPDPGYPVYPVAVQLAGGTAYSLRLTAERGFLPDFDAVPADIADKAKLLFINYPSNPTSAVADIAFFERAVAFAKQHGIVVVHDMAYSEIAYDEYVPPSFLEAA